LIAQGQAGPGLVRKPENKQKKKGKNGAHVQNAPGRRKGIVVVPQAESKVPEDSLFRHHEVERAHSDAVMSVVMLEEAVYTASRDKLVKRWKPQRNASGHFELTADLEVPLGEVAWCLTGVGEWLFCGLGKGDIKAYSKSGSKDTLEGHTKRVTCLLQHQHVLLSGAYDGTIRCWQFDAMKQSFACTHTISEGLPEQITCMTVLNDCLWVGGSSGVSILVLATLKVARQLPPKKFVAGMVEFQGHMIVAYQEGNISIFNAGGDLTHEQKVLPAGPVACVAGLESGPRLLVGHFKGQISSIVLPMFQLKHSWQSLARSKVRCISCAGHDGIFVVGGEDGSLQLWQRDPAAP